MYRLALLSWLMVVGALGQHQVSQQITQPDRQIRLEDVERDGQKSAAGGSPQYQAVPVQYQSAPAQYHPHQYQIAPLQYQAASPVAQYQQAPGPLPQFLAQATFPQQLQGLPQQYLAPGALGPAYSQGGLLQPLLVQPGPASPYNLPFMLIPYQDGGLLSGQFLLGPAPLAPAAKGRPPLQQVLPQGKFRPSQQVSQAPNPYSDLVYQQHKYPAGAKSTVAPPTKDSYVQNPSNYNFKLR